MRLTREILFAYVEGRLEPEEAQRVAAELAEDPELRAYLDEQKRLKERLEAALPADTGETAHDASDTARSLDGAPRPAFAARAASWIPAAAMAAGVLLGVLLALSFGTEPEISGRGGQLLAQGALSRTLSTQLSSEAEDEGAPTRIGVSFFSRDGLFCRSFETRGAQAALSGIACRENEGWQITAVAQSERRAATVLGPAGTAMPAAIRGAIAAMMVGEPLDDAGERAARAQGWRPL